MLGPALFPISLSNQVFSTEKVLPALPYIFTRHEWVVFLSPTNSRITTKRFDWRRDSLCLRLCKISTGASTICRSAIAAVGRNGMRNDDHETCSCDAVGGDGVRRRIDARLCPGRWAWRLWPHGCRAQSFHAAGLAGTDDADFSKLDSGPASGSCAGARHQWAVGTQPVRRRY